MFDFNVVITNLNKVSNSRAVDLIAKLRGNIHASEKNNEVYAIQYADIPMVGTTILEQQKLLYHAPLEWLNIFEIQTGKK